MDKPDWLITAQKIYPLSDDEYYKMLISAERSAKIELNNCNAFTPPNYQRKYIKSVGKSIVIDAAIKLKYCKDIINKVKLNHDY